MKKNDIREAIYFSLKAGIMGGLLVLLLALAYMTPEIREELVFGMTLVFALLLLHLKDLFDGGA